MREAVVSVGPELLADRGFQFEVFREAGVLDTEVLSCEGPRGVFRVHVEERLDEPRLDAMDAVEWYERVSSDGAEHVYLVEAGPPGDGTPGSGPTHEGGEADEATDGDGTTTDEDRFPRCEQLRVTDRGLTVTWAGPRDRLHEQLSELDASGTDLSLEALRGYRPQGGPLDALTDRQREVLEAAFERGYYDVPREASVREVAAEFDVDDSTVAEHLQRAERNLLRRLLGDPTEATRRSRYST